MTEDMVGVLIFFAIYTAIGIVIHGSLLESAVTERFRRWHAFECVVFAVLWLPAAILAEFGALFRRSE